MLTITTDPAGNLYETVLNCNFAQKPNLPTGWGDYVPVGSEAIKITPDGIRTSLAAGDFFSDWQGIASDTGGNLYVTNTPTGGGGSPSIQKITPGGVVTTLASNLENSGGLLTGLAIDGSNNLYAIGSSSSGDVSILKITQAGVVTTIADFNGTAPIKLSAVPVAIVFVAPNTLALASAKSVFRLTLP